MQFIFFSSICISLIYWYQTLTYYYLLPILQINQELDKYSLSADSKQVLCSCLMSRQDELQAALINNTAGITNAYLRDFDWKVKVSLKNKSFSFKYIYISLWLLLWHNFGIFTLKSRQNVWYIFFLYCMYKMLYISITICIKGGCCLDSAQQ